MPDKQGTGGEVAVSVDITNTGTRKGDEVVQLYVHDEVSSVTVYEEQLRGFERVSLEPGEKKTVRFVLHPDDLSLLDKNMVWRVEPGKFQVLIGSSSADLRLKQEFEITP
jgi:beta-glucosidase